MLHRWQTRSTARGKLAASLPNLFCTEEAEFKLTVARFKPHRPQNFVIAGSFEAQRGQEIGGFSVSLMTLN